MFQSKASRASFTLPGIYFPPDDRILIASPIPFTLSIKNNDPTHATMAKVIVKLFILNLKMTKIGWFLCD